jgi:hypothetical protein
MNTNNNVIKTQHVPVTVNKKVIVVLIAFLFLGALVSAFIFGQYISNLNSPKIVQVHEVFSDINGDGKPDLIVYGEVIMNTGQANFPSSQANNK